MVILDTKEWARVTFGSCELGDRRRTERLVKLAEQVAARPDGSTPEQTESWGDCKAAYRLFAEEDVSFEAIIEPHCHQTRQAGRPGEVKLLINDTTEINYGCKRKARGLGPTGKGFGRGFFVHSALMVDADDGRVEGLAGQLIFYRKPKSSRQVAKNTRRRAEDRESVAWGQLVDQVGRAAVGVKWVHVCDRGADDFEVFCRILALENSFVIRAAKLHRKIITPEGKEVTVEALLQQEVSRQIIELPLPATKKTKKRVAQLELRFTALQMPVPRVLSPWLKKRRPVNEVAQRTRSFVKLHRQSLVEWPL